MLILAVIALVAVVAYVVYARSFGDGMQEKSEFLKKSIKM